MNPVLQAAMATMQSDSRFDTEIFQFAVELGEVDVVARLLGGACERPSAPGPLGESLHLAVRNPVRGLALVQLLVGAVRGMAAGVVAAWAAGGSLDACTQAAWQEEFAANPESQPMHALLADFAAGLASRR